MLNTYTISSAGLSAAPETPTALKKTEAWIDLLDPTPGEVRDVETALGLTLPTRDRRREIELSSRIYAAGNAMVFTVPLVWKSRTESPEVTPVTFVRIDGALITLRDVDPQSFITFRQGLTTRTPPLTGADQVFLALLDAIIDRTADTLEMLAQELNGISKDVFRIKPTGPVPKGLEVDLEATLRSLGGLEEMIGMIMESLVGLERVMIALAAMDKSRTNGALRTRIKAQHRDVASLEEHASALAQKVAFLLDATLGFINIEQTQTIKSLSVIASVFLPPTLIASMYGMNFEIMPELHWTLGYPWAIGLMIASAVVPYVYFKRKGWF